MTETVSRQFHIGKEIRKGYLASVYNYRPRNEEILSRKGEVFAVLRLKSDPGFDLLTAGGILLDYFHETYFEMHESSTLLALEKTVISSGNHLAKLIEKEDKVSKTGVEMDLIASAIVGDTVFFVNVGSSSIFIYRDGKQVDLIPALKDPTGEGLVEVASMKLYPNDRLLLSTQPASSLMSSSQIGKILKKFDLSEFPSKGKNDHEHALMLMGYSLGSQKDEEFINDEVLAVIEEEDYPKDGLIKKEELKEQPAIENKEELEESVAEKEVSGEIEEIQSDEFGIEDSEPNLEGEESSVDKEDFTREDIYQGNTEKQTTYKVLLANTKQSIKTIPAKISAKISQSGDRENRGRDGHGTSLVSQKRKYLTLGIVIVLCAGALYLGVRQAIKNNEEKVQVEEVKVSLDALKKKVELVEDLVSEVKIADSTEKRQQGLSEIELAKAEIEKVKDSDTVKEDVEQYRQKLEFAQDFFNRVVSVSKDDKLVDVASFFPDAKISDIAFSADKLYLTDEGLGKIYSVGYDGSNIEEIVSGLVNPKSITVDNAGKVIFLDELEDNRIGIYDPETSKTKRLAGTSQAKIGTVADMEYVQIGGGRLYFVDTTNKRVMYMEKSGENYGLPASRFTLDELATGKDIYIIDNKIYTLAEFKQGLYRFFNGQDDSPELIGLPEGKDMRSATGMFIDGTNIYLTDPTTNRIAIFDKGIQTAKFKGQFKSKDNKIFSGIKDLVVVPSQGVAYAIDQSVIYKLELSKLNEL